MKINWVAIICGLMAALVFISACSTLHPKEPRYEGKRLSVWAVEHKTWTKQDEPPARFAAAESTWTNVVQAVGTNGLPYYAQWIGDASNPYRQYRSQHAIEILGPAAEPIIPILAGLLKDGKTASVAGSCLLAIGPASIPSLIEAVATLTNRGQTCAITMLGEFGPAAKPALPILIQIVKSESPLAWPAMQTLVEIETNIDILLPLLARHVADTNSASGAAYALGRLGNPGVPLLLQSLTNESRSIRCFAAGALDLRFQKRSDKKMETDSFRFRRLCAIYNMRVLGAASRSYSQGDWVVAAQIAEQFTNSVDATIRDSANKTLSVLLPLAATNVPQMKLEDRKNQTPYPNLRK